MSKNRRKKQKSFSAQGEDSFSSEHAVTIPKPERQAIEDSNQEDASAYLFNEIEQNKPADEPTPPHEEREIRVVVSEPRPEPPRYEQKSAKHAYNKTERIGDLLRETRLRRGDDLYMVAEYLCIKPAFLIALENSRYDEIPADAYVIGFLRTYANFLGLDGKVAVDRYRYEMAGRRKKPILTMPTPVSEGRMPSAVIMVGATIALIFVYALWYNLSSSNRAEVLVPPPLPTVVQPIPDVDALANQEAAQAGLTAPVAESAMDQTTAAPAPSAPTAAPEMTETPVAPTAALVEQPAPTAVVAPAVQAPTSSAPLVPVGTTANANAIPLPPPTAAKASIILPPLPDKHSEATMPPVPLGIVVSGEKPPAEIVKEPVAEKPAKNADEMKAQIETETQSPSSFGDPSARVVIRAVESSWVMVVNESGKTLFDRTLKPGESYRVPNTPGLSLTTGNGRGIILSLDGKDLPKVSTGGPHVVRNIPLDPDKM